MVWCGVCGVVWCDMVHDMVWCGVMYVMVWYGVVCYVMVWYGMVWYSGMVWYVTVCYLDIIIKFNLTTIISLNSFCDFSLLLRCSTNLSKADVQL